MSTNGVSGVGILRSVAEDTQWSETPVTALAGVITPVVPANPARFAIGFATTSFGGLVVTTDSDPSNTHGFDVKFPGITWLYAKDCASYCQAAFNVRGRGTDNVLTVIEITYLR